MLDTGLLSYRATPIDFGKRDTLFAVRFSRLNAYLLAEAGRIVLITMQSAVVSKMTGCFIRLNRTLLLLV